MRSEATSNKAGGFRRPLRRALLTALALWCLAGLAGEKPAPLFPGAISNLGGLTLWATLPYAHYGPGQSQTLLLTFQNKGNRSVSFRGNGECAAVFIVDGKERTFPQEQAKIEAGRPLSQDGFCRLAPGESLVARLTVNPPRKEMLPGIYSLRVYFPLVYRFDSPNRTVSSPLTGTLGSNEVHVKIKYDVMVVY